MSDDLLDNYNPLYDVHLRQYFALPHMQRHLRNIGLLNDEQSGSSDDTELYLRHHAMIDRMLKNREVELQKYADLQKKLEAAEKIEICRRIRSGVTNLDTYHRAKPSRSLSRGRLMAKRHRRSSTSTDEKDLIKKIESENEEPQYENPKLVFNRLSTKILKYRYLHKLDDETLAAYMEQLRRQLYRLERFCEISFGPYSVARHQSDPHVSWFFRRRSLPSLNGANTLHESPQRNSQTKRRSRSGKSSSPKLGESGDSRSLHPLKKRRRSSSNNNRKLPPIARTAKTVLPTTVPSTVAKLPPPEKEKTTLSKKAVQKTVIRKRNEPVRVQKAKPQVEESGFPQLTVVGVPATLNSRNGKQTALTKPEETVTAVSSSLTEPVGSPDSLLEEKINIVAEETGVSSSTDGTFTVRETEPDEMSKVSISGSTVSIQEEQKIQSPTEAVTPTVVQEAEQHDKKDIIDLMEHESHEEHFPGVASEIIESPTKSGVSEYDVMHEMPTGTTQEETADTLETDINQLDLQQQHIPDDRKEKYGEMEMSRKTFETLEAIDNTSEVMGQTGKEVISHMPAPASEVTDVAMDISSEAANVQKMKMDESMPHEIETVEPLLTESTKTFEESHGLQEERKTEAVSGDIRPVDELVEKHEHGILSDVPQVVPEITDQGFSNNEAISQEPSVIKSEPSQKLTDVEMPASVLEQGHVESNVLELQEEMKETELIKHETVSPSEQADQEIGISLGAVEQEDLLKQDSQHIQYHDEALIDIQNQISAPLVEIETSKHEGEFEAERIASLQMGALQAEVINGTSELPTVHDSEANFEESKDVAVDHEEEHERLMSPPPQIDDYGGEQKIILTEISMTPEDEIRSTVGDKQRIRSTETIEGIKDEQEISFLTSEAEIQEQQQQKQTIDDEQSPNLQESVTALAPCPEADMLAETKSDVVQKGELEPEVMLTEKRVSALEAVQDIMHQGESEGRLTEEVSTLEAIQIPDQSLDESEKHALQSDVASTDLNIETDVDKSSTVEHPVPVHEEVGISKATSDHSEVQQYPSVPIITSGTEEQSETEAETTSRTVDEEIRKVFAQMTTDSEDTSILTSPSPTNLQRDDVKGRTIIEENHNGIAWEIPAYGSDETPKPTISECIHIEERTTSHEQRSEYEPVVQGILTTNDDDFIMHEPGHQILHRTPDINNGTQSPVTAMDANIDRSAPVDDENKSIVADKPLAGEEQFIKDMKESEKEMPSEGLEWKSKTAMDEENKNDAESKSSARMTPVTPPPSATNDLEVFSSTEETECYTARKIEKPNDDDDVDGGDDKMIEKVYNHMESSKEIVSDQGGPQNGVEHTDGIEKVDRKVMVVPPQISIDYATENFLTSEAIEAMPDINENEVKNLEDKPKPMVISDDQNHHEEMSKNLDNLTAEDVAELREMVEMNDDDDQKVAEFVEGYVNDIVKDAVSHSEASNRSIREQETTDVAKSSSDIQLPSDELDNIDAKALKEESKATHDGSGLITEPFAHDLSTTTDVSNSTADTITEIHDSSAKEIIGMVETGVASVTSSSEAVTSDQDLKTIITGTTEEFSIDHKSTDDQEAKTTITSTTEEPFVDLRSTDDQGAKTAIAGTTEESSVDHKSADTSGSIAHEPNNLDSSAAPSLPALDSERKIILEGLATTETVTKLDAGGSTENGKSPFVPSGDDKNIEGHTESPENAVITSANDNIDRDHLIDTLVAYPQISGISNDGIAMIGGLYCIYIPEDQWQSYESDTTATTLKKRMVSDKNGNIEIYAVDDVDDDDDKNDLNVYNTSPINNGTEKIVEEGENVDSESSASAQATK